MGLLLRLKGRLIRLKNRAIISRAKRKLQINDCTLISQNCIGGVLYHDLGLQFLSPTINAFIPEPDFVKFVLDLRHYMGQELVMQWGEEYPLGMLDDITIHFMHYDTCADAKEAWDRRKTRINWDKIFVIATDRDGFDETVYEQWKQVPYHKILFTAHQEYTEDALFYPEYAAEGQVGDLISQRKFYHQQCLINAINYFVKSK